jgi:hypothetical protein
MVAHFADPTAAASEARLDIAIEKLPDNVTSISAHCGRKLDDLSK